MPKQTQQEINTDLQGQIDDLSRQIKEFKEKPQILDTKKFEDIKFFPQLKVDNLTIKYLETTTALEPTILINTICLWKDTTLTKYYIKSNFNGTAKKIELV